MQLARLVDSSYSCGNVEYAAQLNDHSDVDAEQRKRPEKVKAFYIFNSTKVKPKVRQKPKVQVYVVNSDEQEALDGDAIMEAAEDLKGQMIGKFKDEFSQEDLEKVLMLFRQSEQSEGVEASDSEVFLPADEALEQIFARAIERARRSRRRHWLNKGRKRKEEEE